jgi:hypothetical protein
MNMIQLQCNDCGAFLGVLGYEGKPEGLLCEVCAEDRQIADARAVEEVVDLTAAATAVSGAAAASVA